MKFLAWRLASTAVALLFLTLLVFALMRVAPGGPFSDDLRAESPEVLKNLRAKYRLDDSLPTQYLRYLGDLLTGDLGMSMRYGGRTVVEIIADKLPVSLQIGAAALLLGLALGILLGALAALRHGSVLSDAVAVGTALGISLPALVVAPLLAYLFGYHLRWLPPAGWSTAAHAVLPVITLAIPLTARIACLTRAGMLDVLGQEFIRTARAKGLSTFTIVTRHALRPSLFPVVSFLAPAAAAVLTGSVVVEKIFQIPGLGPDFVTAALARDYTLVMGIALLYSVMLGAFNFLADVAYVMLDPRVRLTRREA
ncbi:MAG: ABC transporter permease [Planctomycetota bacterium]|nr:ABC transporter permease [Planctomycetota bacterium]